MKRKWICLELGCKPGAADELAAGIGDVFGVAVEVLAEGLRLYLPEEVYFKEGKQKLESILNDSQLLGHDTPAVLSCIHSTLEEQDWLEQWKRDFKPLRVGKRLVVAPTWEAVPTSPGDLTLRIDPGQAFGTGHHETTRLCLEWLEARAESWEAGRSESLLDVGTGSGILAIAAALLGFDPVLALDDDADAVQVAGENLALNAVSDKVGLQVGTVAAATGTFDVVLANIQALPLMEMAPLLAACLASSGRIALSGILLEQAAMVQGAYEAQGLGLLTRRDAGEWCLLEFAWAQGRRE